MLQRRQSLYMLLAAAFAIISFKLPFYTGQLATAPGTSQPLTATNNIGILIITVIIAGVSLVNIFNYKNRKLQLRLTVGLVVLSLVNIFLYYQQTQSFVNGTFALAALLTLLIPVLLIMAARGIFKDQKLIKSADRLR